MACGPIQGIVPGWIIERTGSFLENLRRNKFPTSCQKKALIPATPVRQAPAAVPKPLTKDGLIEIEPVEGGLEAIISKLKPKE